MYAFCLVENESVVPADGPTLQIAPSEMSGNISLALIRSKIKNNLRYVFIESVECDALNGIQVLNGMFKKFMTDSEYRIG